MSREETALRRAVGRYLPSHFRDPLGLAGRLLRSGDPDAWYAGASALLGLAATPLDLLLEPLERRHRARAAAPSRPIVFVVGPPRSGTTLVAQTLIRCLPVAYLTNLTALFPRAPVTAARLFRARLANDRVRPRSHYGRTARLFGPNDGLQLWDRWVGEDRTSVPAALSPDDGDSMIRFFGAWETRFGRPVLAKNNGLCLFAALVADALPTARFLCMRREPLFLAQSLLQARRYIHGSSEVPYGPHAPERDAAADPFDDVCAQVIFHEAATRAQQEKIGAERFHFVGYEAFCEDPGHLVARVAEEMLGEPAPQTGLAPFEASRRRTLPPDEFARLEQALARAEAGLG